MCILQFGKIFVISLPSRVDRRDAMVLAAAVSGLDIEFVNGVVGGDIDPKTINLVGEGHDLRQSELGIWRAHLNVYRKIVQQKITSALIMEVSLIHPRKLTYQMLEELHPAFFRRKTASDKLSGLRLRRHLLRRRLGSRLLTWIRVGRR